MAVIWVFVNGPVEGPKLLVLAPTQAITTADLVSVALIVVAVALIARG